MTDGPAHKGTFIAGFLFFVVGVVFTLEELGAFNVRLADLWVVGPVALIAAGVAIVAVTLWPHRHDRDREHDQPRVGAASHERSDVTPHG